MLHHVLVCRACMYFLMPALAFRRLAYVVAPSLCCCFVCLLCFTARSLADSLCTLRYVRVVVEHDEIGPGSFGIVVCRSVGAVPCILGLI